MEHNLWAFVLLCFLLTITPGADTALVVKSSVQGGKRSFVAAIAGISAGLIFHAILSSLGISAVLNSSDRLYSVLKTAGAGYLIYLGLQALYEAWIKNFKGIEADVPNSNSEVSIISNFQSGVITNVLNPKVAVFYLTFLPQFVTSAENVFFQSLLLALIHILLSALWLFAVGWFVVFFKSYFGRPPVRRLVESVTGLAFIGFGISLFFN